METDHPPERYWKIAVYDGTRKIFEKCSSSGLLSEREMTTLLQRLAAADLTPDEIIRASPRRKAKDYAPLLELIKKAVRQPRDLASLPGQPGIT